MAEAIANGTWRPDMGRLPKQTIGEKPNMVEVFLGQASSRGEGWHSIQARSITPGCKCTSDAPHTAPLHSTDDEATSTVCD